MQQSLVSRDATLLVGLSFYGDPFAGGPGWSDENQIGRLWHRFNALLDARRREIEGLVEPVRGFEVHMALPEDEGTGRRGLFVGVAVARAAPAPLPLVFLALPGGEYVLYRLQGTEIGSDWPRAIHDEWLPAAGLASRLPLAVEVYGPDFHGPDDPASVLEVWVPVGRKSP